MDNQKERPALSLGTDRGVSDANCDRIRAGHSPVGRELRRGEFRAHGREGGTPGGQGRRPRPRAGKVQGKVNLRVRRREEDIPC